LAQAVRYRISFTREQIFTMIALLFLFSLAAAEEVEDLLALQIKTGSNSSLTSEKEDACPMPAGPDSVGGKKCGGNVCINDNKKYSNIEDAWTACGNTTQCGFVMEKDGMFQLRRYNDPDAYEGQARGYSYTCCKGKEEGGLFWVTTTRKGGKKCGPRTTRGPPKCINGNKAYNNVEDAWKGCAKEPECDFIMKQKRDSKYYLRRGTDPDIEDGEGYEKKCCGPPVVTATNDVGRKCAYFCINDNTGYMSLGQAWKKCSEVEECGSIWANQKDNKYYLRRKNDPEMGPQTLADGNTTTTIGYKYDCAHRKAA